MRPRRALGSPERASFFARTTDHCRPLVRYTEAIGTEFDQEEQSAMRWILLCALLIALPATADTVYQWTDALGRVHFSDRPPPESVEAIRIPTPGTPSSNATSSRAATSPSPRVRQRRCTDFRGAIVQLEQIAAPEERGPQWHQAREVAVRGVARWCDTD